VILWLTVDGDVEQHSRDRCNGRWDVFAENEGVSKPVGVRCDDAHNDERW
jgi:hypothetical protein